MLAVALLRLRSRATPAIRGSGGQTRHLLINGPLAPLGRRKVHGRVNFGSVTRAVAGWRRRRLAAAGIRRCRTSAAPGPVGGAGFVVGACHRPARASLGDHKAGWWSGSPRRSGALSCLRRRIANRKQDGNTMRPGETRAVAPGRASMSGLVPAARRYEARSPTRVRARDRRLSGRGSAMASCRSDRGWRASSGRAWCGLLLYGAPAARAVVCASFAVSRRERRRIRSAWRRA